MSRPTVTPRWAEDAAWVDPGQAWNGASTKVDPAAIRGQGFKPGATAAPNANHLNAELDLHGEWIEDLDRRPDWTNGTILFGDNYTETYRLAPPVMHGNGNVYCGAGLIGAVSGLYGALDVGLNSISPILNLATTLKSLECAVAKPGTSYTLFCDVSLTPTLARLKNGNWGNVAYAGNAAFSGNQDFLNLLAYDANLAGGAFLVCSDVGFRYSTDPGGVGWTEINLSGVGLGGAESYVVHPTTACRIIVDENGGDLFRCPFGSLATTPANWTNVLTPRANATVSNRTLVPFGGQSWLYLAESGCSYVSSDNGVTWTEYAYSTSMPTRLAPPSAGQAKCLPGHAVWCGDRLIGVGFQAAQGNWREPKIYESFDGVTWRSWPIGIAANFHSAPTYLPAHRRVIFSYQDVDTSRSTGKLNAFVTGMIGAGSVFTPG